MRIDPEDAAYALFGAVFTLYGAGKAIQYFLNTTVASAGDVMASALLLVIGFLLLKSSVPGIYKDLKEEGIL